MASLSRLFQRYPNNHKEAEETQLTPVALRLVCGARPEEHPSVY